MTRSQFRHTLAVMAAFAGGAILSGAARFGLSVGAVAVQLAPFFVLSFLLLVIVRAGVPRSARAVASFFLALAYAWESWPLWFRDSMAHVAVEKRRA